MSSKFACHCYGGLFTIGQLDAKPASLAGVRTTHEMLAERSHEDFTTLECRDCYGPAWVKGIDA